MSQVTKHPYYRRIVVYNTCLISMSDTFSDEVTKTPVLNIEKGMACARFTVPRNLI